MCVVFVALAPSILFGIDISISSDLFYAHTEPNIKS